MRSCAPMKIWIVRYYLTHCAQVPTGLRSQSHIRIQAMFQELQEVSPRIQEREGSKDPIAIAKECKF